MEESWVSARAKCSVDKLLSDLENVVKDDVTVINKICKSDLLGRKFDFDSGTTQFTVTRSDAKGAGWTVAGKVEFVKEDLHLRIVCPAETFIVLPGLSNSFECVAVMDDTEVPLWRISQRGLTKLFFGA